MAITPVFLELSETISEMNDQRDALIFLALTSNDSREAERLASKRDVLAAYILALETKRKLGKDARESYTALMKYAVDELAEVQPVATKNAELFGMLEGYKLVIEKLTVALG